MEDEYEKAKFDLAIVLRERDVTLEEIVEEGRLYRRFLSFLADKSFLIICAICDKRILNVTAGYDRGKGAIMLIVFCHGDSETQLVSIEAIRGSYIQVDLGGKAFESKLKIESNPAAMLTECPDNKRLATYDELFGMTDGEKIH